MENETAPAPGLWRQFRMTWRAMFAEQAMVLLFGFAVAGPLLSGFVSISVRTSGNPVINDHDIPSALTTPGGILLLIAVSTFWLTMHLVGYSAQLVVAHRAIEGGDTRALACLGFVIRRSRGLVILSLRFLLQSAVLALPFLLLIAGVISLQLGQRELSYYVTEQPPEFILALTLTALLATAMIVTLVRHTVDWLHALPLFLFGGETPSGARRRSRKLAKGHRAKLFLSLVAWLLLPPLVIAAANIPWPPLILWVAERAEHRIGLISLLIGVVFGFSALIGLLIQFTSVALFALYHLRLFNRTGYELPPAPTVGESAASTRRIRLTWQLAAGIALIVIAITTVSTYHWLEDLKKDRPVAVIAHRGASSLAPENTLAAVQEAIDSGADWVEIDIQQHRGGEVFVFHDRTLQRIAGNPVALRDADPELLGEIDAGSWFGKEFETERIPTLREVLKLCAGKIGVLIELKYFGGEEGFEKSVVSVIDDCEMAKSVRLMSFDLDGLRGIQALRPEWEIGLLTKVSIGNPTGLRFDFIAVGQGAIGSKLLNRAERAGVDVYIWTLNDPVAISTAISAGADGVITDHPRVAQRVIKARSELNPGERLMIDLAEVIRVTAPLFR